MDLGLKGRKAIIAGASQGIGRATSRLLSAEGAEIFMIARGSAELESLARSLNAGWYAADLTKTSQTNAAVDAACEAFGAPPDILVTSIGAAQGGLFWELDDAVWQDAFDLKLMGMVRLMRAVAPKMLAAGSGRMLAIVGNNGKQPGARVAPGSAVNAACLAVIRSLAEELAGKGVSVNALNPGPTRTGRWDRMVEGLAKTSGRARSEIEGELLAALPLGRLSEPDEIARLAVMMVSDAVDIVTGTSLTADGGATRGLA